MKISAIFESVDHAEIAAHNIKDAGVHIESRDITDLASHSFSNSHLPTDEFYFPAASEFYTGAFTNFATPASSFFPMAGHAAENSTASGGEAELTLEISESDESRVRNMLREMHGTRIQNLS